MLIYEISFGILAIISVAIAIGDIATTLPSWIMILDTIIYWIFVIEYVSRFLISKDKKTFVKTNIFDLIAIIPFNSAFRAFRALKLTKLLKLAKISKVTKLTRLAAVIVRMAGKCKKFLDTNGFKYMLLLSVCLIFIGGTAISVFEEMNFVDGIWWAFVTTTTVGYGDISPSSFVGRIIACILMIVGIGLIGSLTSTITTFFMTSSKNDTSVSSDRVDMVLKLYNELNAEEKEIFKKFTK